MRMEDGMGLHSAASDGILSRLPQRRLAGRRGSPAEGMVLTGSATETWPWQATYGTNSRPRRLELVSVDGQLHYRFELEDQLEWNDASDWSHDSGYWQTFDDVRLSPGTYRIYIREVSEGSGWDGAGLGEIDFHLAEPGRPLEADEFLREVLSGG